jgi:hypothetical protein
MPWIWIHNEYASKTILPIIPQTIRIRKQPISKEIPI